MVKKIYNLYRPCRLYSYKEGILTNIPYKMIVGEELRDDKIFAIKNS